MIFNLTGTDNAPNNYSIIQGSRFSFIVHYPTLDFTTWTFAGHIRQTYDSTTILAAFNFGPVTFGTREGKTGNWSSFEVYLDATDTAALPIPSSIRQFRTDSAIEGTNVWVYDIEAYDPADSENIIKVISKSYVEVIPEVTRV